MSEQQSEHNPMQHPDEQPAGIDRPLRLGRLVIVLLIAVLTIAALAVAAVAYYT